MERVNEVLGLAEDASRGTSLNEVLGLAEDASRGTSTTSMSCQGKWDLPLRVLALRLTQRRHSGSGKLRKIAALSGALSLSCYDLVLVGFGFRKDVNSYRANVFSLFYKLSFRPGWYGHEMT
ncbi:hypothetical protein PoB_002215800 [Plakobranchus ocellatus]|uniref:Uncharacterized protein n=1 Tax=Plakobranchus ocellatus TaxID=259542 RepID=A0AAV3ZM41_9GAST|nr:hypothetical protein PoB_002215800 [Plakobranchus ocellatus]